MRTLTRFALNILASFGGISPVLVIGVELPGGAQPQLVADPEELWITLSKPNFGSWESKREAAERAKTDKQWGQAIDLLLGLCADQSIQGYRRAILLNNLAVASSYAQVFNGVNPAIERAEEILSGTPMTNNDEQTIKMIKMISGRISLTRKSLYRREKNQDGVPSKQGE